MGERQEVASRQGLLAELQDIGAPPHCGSRQGNEAVGLVVGSDDVEPGGLEPL
jgi:hypothetical protein